MTPIPDPDGVLVAAAIPDPSRCNGDCHITRALRQVLREVLDAEARDDPGTKVRETVRTWIDDKALVARAEALIAGTSITTEK